MTGPLPWAVRPLPPGDVPRIPGPERVTPFQAPFADTVTRLGAELRYLSAAHVVLEVEGLLAGQIPAGDAVYPTVLGQLGTTGPRVRLSFDSRLGPLSYATGRFGVDAGPMGWRQNLRAVALGLDALRRVDRFGIATAGEQYSGWLRLPAGEPARSAAVLLELARTPAIGVTQVIGDAGTFHRLYQAAARLWDPDAGGDVAVWARLQRARAVLLDHYGEAA